VSEVLATLSVDLDRLLEKVAAHAAALCKHELLAELGIDEELFSACVEQFASRRAADARLAAVGQVRRALKEEAMRRRSPTEAFGHENSERSQEGPEASDSEEDFTPQPTMTTVVSGVSVERDFRLHSREAKEEAEQAKEVLSPNRLRAFGARGDEGTKSMPVGRAALNPGSRWHSQGTCVPCAWFWKPQGCQNGQECRHCHLCPEGEIKARKKKKLAAMRSVSDGAECGTINVSAWRNSPPGLKSPGQASESSDNDQQQAGAAGSSSASESGVPGEARARREREARETQSTHLRACLVCESQSKADRPRTTRRAVTLQLPTRMRSESGSPPRKPKEEKEEKEVAASVTPAKLDLAPSYAIVGVGLPPGLEEGPGPGSMPDRPMKVNILDPKGSPGLESDGCRQSGGELGLGSCPVHRMLVDRQLTSGREGEFGTKSMPLLLPPTALNPGSKNHGNGDCRPCGWFWKPQGCHNGQSCLHCHLCPEHEIKSRRKKKMADFRSGGLSPSSDGRRVLELSSLLSKSFDGF